VIGYQISTRLAANALSGFAFKLKYMLERYWNVFSRNSTIVFLALICCLAGVGVLTIALPGFVNASPTTNTIKDNVLTPNEIAAGGPIPQNYTLAQQEQKCITEQKNPPRYPTMNAFERGDSNRTGMYGCATFTGSFTGPNTVYAYRSPNIYYTHAIMSTRGINEMYVYGGSQFNSKPLPISPYVARIEPGTLKELWRTVLLNVNISKPWTGVGGMESLGANSMSPSSPSTNSTSTATAGTGG